MGSLEAMILVMTGVEDDQCRIRWEEWQKLL